MRDPQAPGTTQCSDRTTAPRSGRAEKTRNMGVKAKSDRADDKPADQPDRSDQVGSTYAPPTDVYAGSSQAYRSNSGQLQADMMYTAKLATCKLAAVLIIAAALATTYPVAQNLLAQGAKGQSPLAVGLASGGSFAPMLSKVLPTVVTVRVRGERPVPIEIKGGAQHRGDQTIERRTEPFRAACDHRCPERLHSDQQPRD